VKCKFIENGAMNLIRITSNTSFTQPATFEKKHHLPPYSIFSTFPWWLHPNVIFPQDSKVGVPKLGLLLSQKILRSYISQIKPIFRMRRQYLIAFKNIFPTVYSTTQSELSWSLLSRGLWLRIKFPIWFLPLLFIITHANQV